MLKDPFQIRETEKYKNQIPSREYILTFLKKLGKPTNRKELIRKMYIDDKEKRKAFYRRLRAMERDGQLVFTHQNCYILPQYPDFFRGKVIGHRDGYGFLCVEGQKNDFYLSTEQMKYCIHGDVILAKLKNIPRKGHREVRVIRVLEPRNSQIVGRYFMDSSIGIVIPYDNRLRFDILIPLEKSMNARAGCFVVVILLRRPTRHVRAIGKVIEILGDHIETNLIVDITLRTHAIPYIWSNNVKSQISTLQEEVLEEEKKGRVDLRYLPMVTIDSEDAHDFDDAVCCEKNPAGGWRLWVAIADTSYYARPGSPIDKEAYNRGTSIYFPFKVIPMLPEVLSNGLCSLNPQVDRLCIVCEMLISDSGKLISYKHYEAVIKSQARLTYNNVWSILQGNSTLCKRYASLVRNLKELHCMYQVLEKSREKRGGILFELEETKFIFNSERRINRIERVVRNDAHKLIEECMILANIASAKFVEKHQEPVLFRDHDRPSDDSVKSFRSVLMRLGLSLSGGSQPKPLDYAELLAIIANRPDQEILQIMLLRSMKQAVYDPENRGHFGLALPSYTHFTSPIRRYPDLLLHRVIKYLIAKQNGTLKGTSTPTGGFHYSTQQMLQLGIHCSMTERRADEAMRDVSDWLKCDFMQNKIGNIFTGIIINVTSFGFFVRLHKLFIDGLVHISTLDSDYYYSKVSQCLIRKKGNNIYRIGDIVEVCVKSVHIDERKINFSLISD